MSLTILIPFFLVALIVAPYILYPVLLLLRARLSSVPIIKDDIFPAVDLVICAHNEERGIGPRIENALDLDYPAERLTIWVASDGSTDRTAEIVRSFAARGVRCLDLPRGGKAAALNTCVSAGNAEVVAFSDANSEWQANALRNLVRSFADERVGGVAGDQRYVEAGSEAAGERSYWSFDRALKSWQSRAGSVISATGAIYAVRRELFQPAPPDATDDFMVSTAVVAQGKRLVFEPDAVALESPATDSGEYRRKVRILTRGLRAVMYRKSLLRPSRSGFYSVQLLLHKLWRRLTWLPLSLLVPALLMTTDGIVFALVAIGALATAALAVIGVLVPASRRFKPVDIIVYVMMVNAACAVATFNALRGKRVSHWTPTGASPSAAP